MYRVDGVSSSSPLSCALTYFMRTPELSVQNVANLNVDEAPEVLSFVGLQGDVVLVVGLLPADNDDIL